MLGIFLLIENLPPISKILQNCLPIQKPIEKTTKK
jgi:hypothetical protein